MDLIFPQSPVYLLRITIQAVSYVISPNAQMKKPNTGTLLKYLDWLLMTDKLIPSHHAISLSHLKNNQ